MTRTFDFYEYAGVIVPGAALLLGALWLVPTIRELIGPEGITFGELGIFVIAAYAAGQLVQGIGNLVEWILWNSLGGFAQSKDSPWTEPHRCADGPIEAAVAGRRDHQG